MWTSCSVVWMHHLIRGGDSFLFSDNQRQFSAAVFFACLHLSALIKDILSSFHISHDLLSWKMLLWIVGMIDSLMLFCLIVFSVTQDSVFKRPWFRNQCNVCIHQSYLISSCWFLSSVATAFAVLTLCFVKISLLSLSHAPWYKRLWVLIFIIKDLSRTPSPAAMWGILHNGDSDKVMDLKSGQ